MTKTKVAVVGAGAAGAFAAIRAAECGADVTVFEKNRDVGRKLRITGKGRCNVTNDCEVREMMGAITKNPRFLYGALSRFSPADTVAFFENLGVPLKTERGRRVFPESDDANDVANALAGEMKRLGVRIVRAAVRSVEPTPSGGFRVMTDGERSDGAGGGFDTPRSDGADGNINAPRFDGADGIFTAVIIATGGVSYPGTGSTGDGHRIARSLGIAVTPLLASLVPVVTEEDCAPMMGLSLRNVRLDVTDAAGKRVYSEQGEMLFTHFGVSGPLVLSASAFMRPDPAAYRMSVDLKPALDEKTLDRRITADFEKNSSREYKNSLGALLPSSIIAEVVRRSGIDAHKKCAQITKAERVSLGAVLKGFTLTPRAFRPIAEAIVTSGGVDAAALDPKTMMAKAVPGLFFAGEIIDVDAFTGGYNLQIAFATGRLAGESASAFHADAQ